MTKKIFFSDRYGLTQAVLKGRKTMTRRIIKGDYENIVVLPHGSYIVGYNGSIIESSAVELHPSYQIGEVVAVAQTYKDIYPNADFEMAGNEFMTETAGWNNKMFVKANLMLHRIRITNIKVERLQDISDEDAMCEGVFKYDKPPLHHECDHFAPWAPYVKPYKHDCDNLKYLCSARFAFAYLIDKVCKKGTWECNPWVFAYEFELVK